MNALQKLRHYRADLTYFNSDNDACVLTPALGVTLFVAEGHLASVREQVAECINLYQSMFSGQLHASLISISDRYREPRFGSAGFPDIREVIAALDPDDELAWQVSGSADLESASAYYVNAFLMRKWQVELQGDLSVLQFALPVSALIDLKPFLALLEVWIKRLNPVHGSANIVTVLPYERHRWQFNEFEALQRYYCVSPFTGDFMAADQLKEKIRSTSWITILGERLAKQVSIDAGLREQIAAAGGQIKQVGQSSLIKAEAIPDLSPVVDGMPELYMALDKALKPVQVDPDEMCLHTGSMNGAINFDERTSALWLRRFEAPDTWPAYPDHMEFFGLGDAEALSDQEAAEIEAIFNDRVLPGSPCPRAGYWYTPAKALSRAYFKKTDVMPDYPGSSYGATIWYWDMNQVSQ